MEINCVIIDDEQLARKGMSNLIKEVPYLKLHGAFSNPMEALSAVDQKNISLVFLDIQMPKMTGMEFLKTMADAPLTIITTAYPNYALESFELNVIDYLIKPIPFDRFLKAVNKAKDYLELQAKGKEGKNTDEEYFFIKCESRFEKIMYDELLYIEALQNYVVLHTVGKRFVCYLTFKAVEDYLPADKFLKVHKSHIVSLDKIESIDGAEIKIAQHSITISRTHKDEILNTIMKNKLLKRV